MSPAFACAVCNGKCLDDEAMGWVFLWREVAAPLIQYIVPTDYVARDKMGETKERKRKRTAVVLWCRRSLFDCFQTHLGLVRRPSWSIELSLSSLSCSVYSVCVICQQVSPGLADQLKEASMTLTRLLLASLPPSTGVMTADGSEICPFPIDYFSLSLSRLSFVSKTSLAPRPRQPTHKFFRLWWFKRGIWASSISYCSSWREQR